MLEAFVQDVRSTPAGVFAAYLDVLFDVTLVAIDGPLTIGGQFPNGHSGKLNVAGLVNEVGGSADFGLPPGNGLVFRLPMHMLQTGQVDFIPNSAEDFPFHYVLLRGVTKGMPASRIEYVGASLLAQNARWQNTKLPADVHVDGDGYLSPTNVLIVINEINRLADLGGMGGEPEGEGEGVGIGNGPDHRSGIGQVAGLVRGDAYFVFHRVGIRLATWDANH